MEKQYRTRCGYKVTVFAKDIENHLEWKYVGLIHHPDWGDVPALWTGELRYSTVDTHQFDLIEYDPRGTWCMDKPIWVRDYDDQLWSPSHFAGIGEDGKTLTWLFGRTRHTAVFVHQSAKAQESWNQATDTNPNI